MTASASLNLLQGKGAPKPVPFAVKAPGLAPKTMSIATPAKPAAQPLPKPALKVVAKSPPPEPEPVEDTVSETAAEPASEAEVTETVDIDSMSKVQLIAFVKENDISVAHGWDKLPVAKMRAWLQDKFGVAEEGKPTVSEQSDTSGSEPEVEVAEANVTGKAVAKTKGKQVSVSGDVIAPNKMSNMIHEVANMKMADARKLVNDLAATADFTYIKLGCVLSFIQEQKWYAPYDTFKEYVESEHGIKYTRATAWIRIYNNIVTSEVPWEKISHLGWTKLNDLAPILTKDNVDAWVKAAEDNTTLQLQSMVKESSKSNASGDESGEVAIVTTKTFKLHADQRKTVESALEKAKTVAGTTVDTVALEFICLDYLGSKGKGKSKPMSVEETMKAAGLTATMAALETSFPEVTFSAELPADAE